MAGRFNRDDTVINKYFTLLLNRTFLNDGHCKILAKLCIAQKIVLAVCNSVLDLLLIQWVQHIWAGPFYNGSMVNILKLQTLLSVLN